MIYLYSNIGPYVTTHYFCNKNEYYYIDVIKTEIEYYKCLLFDKYTHMTRIDIFEYKLPKKLNILSKASDAIELQTNLENSKLKLILNSI